MSDVEEFPYLVNQLLQSGTQPEGIVGCLEAFFSFSKRGCVACHHAGIEFSHFICDSPNCSGFRTWCCHSCMVLRTSEKSKTYNEGWYCYSCYKKTEFDEDSVDACSKLELKLVQQAIPGYIDPECRKEQSADGNCKRDPKSTGDGSSEHSSKDYLLKDLEKKVFDDAIKTFPKAFTLYEWTHYHPPTKIRKEWERLTKETILKRGIAEQLKHLTEEQMKDEIDRYDKYEDARKSLVKYLIGIVTKSEKGKEGFKWIWTHYDPTKRFGLEGGPNYGKKQSIRCQLEDLTLAQLKLEIARYEHAIDKKVREPYIASRRVEEADKTSDKTVQEIVYRLPLGPLEKLRSKSDQRTIVFERARELKRLMDGSSSSGAASSSSSSSSSSGSKQASSSNAAATNEIEELKSTIEQLNEQAKNDHEKNEQLKAVEAAKLASSTIENDKLMKKNKTLEDEVSRLGQENESWKSELQSVVNENKSLIKQNKDAVDLNDHLKSGLEGKEIEIEEFEENARKQQAIVDEQQVKLKALEEVHEEIKKYLMTIQNEKEALETENAVLVSQNAGLENTVVQLNTDIKTMETGAYNNNEPESTLPSASFSPAYEPVSPPPTPPPPPFMPSASPEQQQQQVFEPMVRWQEKCAEEPSWTTNHSHVGKCVAKYFPCQDEGREGE